MNATAVSSLTDKVAPPRFDFPTWLPPMLVKELRQGLRARGFVGALMGVQTIMVIMLVWAFAIEGAVANSATSMVNGFFWGLLGLLLFVITPTRGLGGLHTEMTSRMIDLLLLTRLTSWRIVLGKWVSLMTQALLLVIAMLPYGVVRYYFGSVDLVSDLRTLMFMLLGCGAATAVALWVSGLPKIIRVLLPVGFFILLQVGSGGFAMMGRGGSSWFSVGSSVGGPGIGNFSLLVFDAGILILFALLQAVRRFAPPAENHAASSRGLVMVMFLPVPLCALAGEPALARGQLVLMLVVLLLVGAMELASLRFPMPVHVRKWAGRGRVRALLGACSLPGWPSAAVFLAAGLGVVALTTLAGGMTGVAGVSAFLWMLVLAWVALVFPILLLAMMPHAAKAAGALYFIIQAVFGILCIVAGNHVTTLLLGDTAHMLERLMHVLPVSSFWLALFGLKNTEDAAAGLHSWQVAMVFLMLMLAWRLSRDYRQFVRHQMKQGVVRAKADPTPPSA
ncbi:MAG: hypothetical protein WC661_11105 [Opitutaceae bacterium]|jgi:hypothetical protein